MREQAYNPNQSVFPITESFKNVIGKKKKDVLCVGVIDMVAPVSLKNIIPYNGTSVDDLRVIFKKSKMKFDDIKMLDASGVKEVFVAGMDGYTEMHADDYFDKNMRLEHFTEAMLKNKLISEELKNLQNFMKIQFLTPTKYQ